MMRFRAGIFDVDGVLLDTPHERAWRDALDRLMMGAWQAIVSQTTYQHGAFTHAVYAQYVAGLPRDTGAQAVLEYFHVPDPDGSHVRHYAETKQALIIQAAQCGDFHVFDDGVRFLLRVKAAGLRVAAASSSKNAALFMQKVNVHAFCATNNLYYPFVTEDTTLQTLFDADTAQQPIAHGKPYPDIFLAAAHALHVAPRECFVVEDAPNGIVAAKAGGMFGIGIARANDGPALQAVAADIVVLSLDDVDLATLGG